MSEQRNELKQLYGTGWRFPLRFTLPTTVGESAVVMSAGTDNVAQSLSLLFQTQPGERIMLPSYGCDLHSAMFTNMSEGTLASLQSQIAESVARYEPRAEAVVVSVRQDTGQTQRGVLRVEVTYRLSGQTQRVTGQLNVLDGSASGGGAWAISW